MSWRSMRKARSCETCFRRRTTSLSRFPQLKTVTNRLEALSLLPTQTWGEPGSFKERLPHLASYEIPTWCSLDSPTARSDISSLDRAFLTSQVAHTIGPSLRSALQAQLAKSARFDIIRFYHGI